MTDRGAARAEGGIVSAMSVSSLIERCVIERCRLIILKTVREGEILSSAKPQHRRDATSDERRRPTNPYLFDLKALVRVRADEESHSWVFCTTSGVVLQGRISSSIVSGLFSVL